MKIEPVNKYDKPNYSSFRLKNGGILPAGLAFVSALTLLSGCTIQTTSGAPSVSEFVEPSCETPSASPAPELFILDGDVAYIEPDGKTQARELLPGETAALEFNTD